MINEVDPYLVFLKVCETIDKCSVVKNNKGFDITIDNIENAVLVEDMKKWGLYQRNSCEWDRKFVATCGRCRKLGDRCLKACNSFNIAKENLFKNLVKEGKDYLENFIKDF